MQGFTFTYTFFPCRTNNIHVSPPLLLSSSIAFTEALLRCGPSVALFVLVQPQTKSIPLDSANRNASSGRNSFSQLYAITLQRRHYYLQPIKPMGDERLFCGQSASYFFFRTSSLHEGQQFQLNHLFRFRSSLAVNYSLLLSLARFSTVDMCHLQRK